MKNRVCIDPDIAETAKKNIMERHDKRIEKIDNFIKPLQEEKVAYLAKLKI